MASLGLLGFGKIGRSLFEHIRRQDAHQVSFVHTRKVENHPDVDCPIVNKPDKDLCKADLIVECATPDVLKKHFAFYIRQGNILIFSLTAFSDKAFAEEAYTLSKRSGKRIYFAHGAIMGLDGIYDARGILTSVTVETVKNPASLGRNDTERTVIFEGRTREVCQLYPRNVNVHAAVALAGIGFGKTVSKLVSDPAVKTNTHTIRVEGDGFHSCLDISSFSTGGVTGSYTPVSACGSLDRILGGKERYQFV